LSRHFFINNKLCKVNPKILLNLLKVRLQTTVVLEKFAGFPRLNIQRIL